MSLLHDIQRAAIEPTTDLPTLLRMCKLLASRLGNVEFGQWVENELNGYPTVESMPQYRVVEEVQSFGNFQGGFGARGRGMPIPLGVLPEGARTNFSKAYLGQGVSMYADLLAAGKDGDFEEQWPIGAALTYATKAIPGYQCIAAWKSIPRGAFVRLLDQVKTRVLGFAIEIERQSPSAGESPLNSPPIKQEVVTQIFHTQISGGTIQNLAAGGRNVAQTASYTVGVGDFAAAESAARELGVSDEGVRELRNALEHDSQTKPPAPFEGKSGKWVQKTLARASKGGLKVGVEVAAAALAKIITSFFGLD